MQLVIETKKARIDKIHQLVRLLTEASDLEGVVLILRSFLGVNPTVFEARYLMRRIQIDQHNRGSHSLMSHSLGKMKAPMMVSKAHAFLEKEPYKALEIAEEILAIDPFDENGNRLVVEIAKHQQNYRLMVLAYETLCVRHPNHVGYLEELGNAYILDQRYAEGKEVFYQLLQLVPNHEGATAGLAKITEMTDRASEWRQETAHFKPGEIERRGAAAAFSPDQIQQRQLAAMNVDEAIIVDPIAEQDTVVARLQKAFESVENHAFQDLSKFDEWQDGVEQREIDRIRYMEQQLVVQPQDPEINFRFGVINMERLHFLEARRQLDISTRHQPLEFISYALLTLCFLHEAVIRRPVEGPSREDFAWFV